MNLLFVIIVFIIVFVVVVVVPMVVVVIINIIIIIVIIIRPEVSISHHSESRGYKLGRGEGGKCLIHY